MNKTKLSWLVIVVGLVVTLVAYKYVEYKTISGLAVKFSNSIVEDFRLESDLNKSSIKLFPEIMAALGFPTEEQVNSIKALKKTDSEVVDDGISALNISKEKNKQYIALTQRHKEEFVKDQKISNFLFGRRGKFAKDFISNQIAYYANIEQSSHNELVDLDLILNMLTVSKDWENLNIFTKMTANNLKNYPKNFLLISSLEKYTRSDFRFVSEDEIKQRNQYGYEMLMRNKEYLGVYYQIVKDVVEGDLDSAGYKSTKLDSVSANFNFDLQKVFDANSDSDLDISKSIVDYVLKQFGLISDFKSKKLGQYPVVNEVGGWKDSLFLCDTFQFRAGIYKSITNKNVKSDNISDLLNEFNDAGIQVVKADKEFDPSLLTIVNDEKKLVFTCKDSDSGEKFEKETTKD